MRFVFSGVIAAALLGGCAAPVSQQLDELNASGACCTLPGQLKAAGTLAAESVGELSPQTPVAMMNGKRTPAVRFLVPAEFAGRKLLVRASPMQAGLYSHGIAFAPVAVAFLSTDGAPIAAAHDTGLVAGPAQSIAYSYALWRTVTVPEGATSAVFYADPALYGTEQTFDYRFGGMVPAGGIAVPMSANAKAFYRVYGEFSVKLL
jgi:hypothetical protein